MHMFTFLYTFCDDQPKWQIHSPLELRRLLKLFLEALFLSILVTCRPKIDTSSRILVVWSSEKEVFSSVRGSVSICGTLALIFLEQI
jgi:hypothetical protein